jgi:hypothetical protein
MAERLGRCGTHQIRVQDNERVSKTGKINSNGTYAQESSQFYLPESTRWAWNDFSRWSLVRSFEELWNEEGRKCETATIEYGQN